MSASSSVFGSVVRSYCANVRPFYISGPPVRRSIIRRHCKAGPLCLMVVQDVFVDGQIDVEYLHNKENFFTSVKIFFS